MNDAGQGQTAEGSWQPDPTGRYKLRWRDSADNWTDHVYSSDGALGNDPYRPARTSSQSEDDTEMLTPEDDQLADEIQDPSKSFIWQVVIGIAIVAVAIVVWNLIGSLIETDSDTTAGKSPQSTTTARTETTNVTTTRRAGTTTRQPAVGAELTAREKACADNWETISHSEMLRMKRDRSIDGIYDWSGGYWVSYKKIMDIC